MRKFNSTILKIKYWNNPAIFLFSYYNRGKWGRTFHFEYLKTFK